MAYLCLTVCVTASWTWSDRDEMRSADHRRFNLLLGADFATGSVIHSVCLSVC